MTAPSYPETLPYKSERSSFVIDRPYQPPAVFEPEDGPPIMRVQSLTRIRKIAYSLRFTPAQLATWDNFASVTLSSGTMRFSMQVQADGNSYAERVVWLDGGMWRAQPSGVDFVVTFTLCILLT